MILCKNTECLKQQNCARTKREYFGSILEVINFFDPIFDKCFIKKREKA